jgi:hypothetical protein
MRTLLPMIGLALIAIAATDAQTGTAVGVSQNVVTPSVDRATVLRDVGIAHGMLRGLQYPMQRRPRNTRLPGRSTSSANRSSPAQRGLPRS